MKNKIYILSPPLPETDGFPSAPWEIAGKLAGGDTIPLGIYYLASFLRENGYEVALADAAAYRLTPEDITREIASFSPAFVGISATTMSFAAAAAMAGRVKEAFPDIVTIIGGSHISSDMPHAMSCRDFDFGVVGEGEVTALELLDALGQNKPLSEIPGVVYRDEKGEPVYTGPRPFIHNLDFLPIPALDLVPDIHHTYRPPLFEHKSSPFMNMITSRGCPDRCTFCSTCLGKTYRARSARNVFEEMKFLTQRYGIREIEFVDDNFLLDKRRIRDLFDMVRAEGMHFHWSCLARINSVDYEFLKFLRDNGCWRISFGIESGDEKILKTIKKNLSLERAAQVIHWCRELGIKTKGLFIMGHPLESLETIDRTINYALGIPLDSLMCTLNTPYPANEQYGQISTYGTLTTTNWSQFNGLTPVFVPHGLTEEILVQKQKEFLVKFYARPGVLFGLIAFFLGKGGVRRLERIRGVAGLVFLMIRMALNRS